MCHLLSYLHLCSEAGIVVLEYSDHSDGVMEQTADGGGRFTRVTLRPVVKIADPAHAEKAKALHHAAHEKCFIANSVNFPVGCEASVVS
jgi:organic hydroperoxide reductase OsmC/OhrA